jgi:hypothetical protein
MTTKPADKKPAAKKIKQKKLMVTDLDKVTGGGGADVVRVVSQD